MSRRGLAVRPPVSGHQQIAGNQMSDAVGGLFGARPQERQQVIGNPMGDAFSAFLGARPQGHATGAQSGMGANLGPLLGALLGGGMQQGGMPGGRQQFPMQGLLAALMGRGKF